MLHLPHSRSTRLTFHPLAARMLYKTIAITLAAEALAAGSGPSGSTCHELKSAYQVCSTADHRLVL